MALWWSVSLHVISTRRLALYPGPNTIPKLPSAPFYLVDHAALLSPIFCIVFFTSLVPQIIHLYLYSILAILLLAGTFDVSVNGLNRTFVGVGEYRRARAEISRTKEEMEALRQRCEEQERRMVEVEELRTELGIRSKAEQMC